MAANEWGIGVSDIKEPSTMLSAIYGMITKLSPLEECARHRKNILMAISVTTLTQDLFHSFNTKLFESMKETKDNSASIALNKCSVKRSALNLEELEIVISDKSEIMQSPKKFKCESREIQPKTIYLSDINKLAISSLISVQAKIIHLDSPAKIDTQKTTYKTRLYHK